MLPSSHLQHSDWNEGKNGRGVSSGVRQLTDYRKISDGNGPLRRQGSRGDRAVPGGFVAAAARTPLGRRAWATVAREFRTVRCHCNQVCKSTASVVVCVDFSDSFELVNIVTRGCGRSMVDFRGYLDRAG